MEITDLSKVGDNPNQSAAFHRREPDVEAGKDVPAAKAKVEWISYAVWATVCVAYFNTFFTRVAPSGIIDDLQREFHVSRAVLGTLSAEYFYPYLVLQVPWGLLLSSYGVRKSMIVSTAVALLGQVLFALAPNLFLLQVGRLLIGGGVSCTFMSFVTITKEWFPHSYAATIMGLTMSVGVVGGSAAQAPLTAMANAIGWREALLIEAVLPLIALLLFIFVVKDFGPYADRDNRHTLGQMWRSVRRQPQVWLVAAVGFFLNTSIMSLNGLWATPFLKNRFGITASQAGLISSAGFIGNGIGSPVFGRLGDKFPHLTKTFVTTSCAMITLAAAGMIFIDVGIPLTVFFSFFVGAGTNINLVIKCFRFYMKSRGEEHYIAFAGSVVNQFFLASPALLQPLVGFILDQQEAASGQAPTDGDYMVALTMFPICTAVATVLSLFIQTSSKKTRQIVPATRYEVS